MTILCRDRPRTPVRRYPHCSFTILALAAACFSAGSIRAATPVTISSTTFGPMNGFDFYDGDLIWWNHGDLGSETTPSRTGQIAVQNGLGFNSFGYPARSFGRPVFLIQANALWAPYQSVARNDYFFFYYAYQSGKVRLFQSPISSPQVYNDISYVPLDQGGAILLVDNVVYYSIVQFGYTEIRSHVLDPFAGTDIEVSF